MPETDKFVAMVTAKADVSLPLSEFQPTSSLVTPVHEIAQARFPAIDYHNHLDALEPCSARAFFLRFADRILFGTDLLPDETMYRLYFRFLETADEYFDYPSHASRQGRWNIYGLHLPDDVLRKVYRENALRLLRL
jgi:hypothetical protein